MKLDGTITIGKLLGCYPGATRFFIRRKMLCVGCPAQAYHTLEDVARIYGVALDDLVNNLNDYIRFDEIRK